MVTREPTDPSPEIEAEEPPPPPKLPPAAQQPRSRDTEPSIKMRRMDTPPPRADTLEVDLDWAEPEPESEDDPPIDPPAPVPSLDAESRAVIATCEAELETQPPPQRAARLHYEIARAYETATGWSQQAADHYQKALDGAPDYVPAIRGARRARILRGEFEAALALYDAEDKLAPSPKRKAMLLYQKGRVLEDKLMDAVRARDAYDKALALDPSNASILKALEQTDRREQRPEALLQTLERVANAITDDARHRAVVLVERARLVERTGPGQGPAAAELYETALRLDPNALGALEALERIYRRDQQWRGLTATLERDARQTEDPERRALALHRLAQVQGDRLGNRTEAVAALVKASAVPSQLVLEDLAREYEHGEEHTALADVLVILVKLASDRRERVALLYRLGALYEGALKAPDRAIERYREALAIEPTYLPVLDALGKLLASRNMWAELVEMHLAEADATVAPLRAAETHARIAEVFEVHLRDPSEAAAHHARALTLVPGHAASFKALDRLYAQLGRHRELVELLERAVDRHSASPSGDAARLGKAEASQVQTSLEITYLMKIGLLWEDALADVGQALHAYSRVLALEPDNLIALHAVERVAERAERWPRLVEALEKEVTLVDAPALRVSLLHRAGTVLDERLGDTDGALARFRRALDIDKTYTPALASYRRIYRRAGRWADLLDAYTREVEVTPAGPDAVALLHQMGELCEHKLGDIDAAIAWYQRAVEMDPTFRPALRALVGRLRERQNWTQLAKILELEVNSLAPSDGANQAACDAERALGWYRIGLLHEDWLGDAKSAIAAYQKALELRPDDLPARTALQRLYTDQARWAELVVLLGRDANTADPTAVASALMRQAEVQRDELGDASLATLGFEALAEHEVGAIPALLALEPLYAKAGAWDKLANVYASLGEKLADPGARIAALRELARIQEGKLSAPARARAETYEQILSVERDDEPALVSLEQIGRVKHDDRILVSVYSRLSELTDNTALAASWLTDLGQSLERLGDRHALEAYRAAVKKDPGILTAIRGLSRVADLRGDARAMVMAARLEAELTRKPELAAMLFVRAGILRREQMNDLGAVEDFERALEVWPDDVSGAERIVQPLLETGQVQRLIDVLSKTATSAKSPERRTALWLEVGNLYSRKLENLGAGITAYKRALDATPGNVVVQSKLAEAYQRNRQWGDAVATLEQLLALTSDQAARAAAHLELAAIFDEHLNNVERATRSIEAVLRLDPKHADALMRLADIQLRSGNEAAAVKTTQSLVDLAESPAKKGAALVRVARIQRARNDGAAADAALGEALALEGPGGEAEREFKKTIGSSGSSWASYAAGLANHIKRAASDPVAKANLPATYIELARTYADGMKLANRAIEALSDGIEQTGGDERLVLALTQRLREAGRLDEALQQLKRAVSHDPIQTEAWRELAIVFDQSGRRDDAARVYSALGLMNAGGDKAIRLAARPASANEGSFDGKVMATIAVDAASSAPAAILLAAIAEGIGKLYPPSLDRYGLTTRDRLSQKANHPVWELATRIAKIFGGELDLFVHDGPEPVIAIEPFENPALVVSHVVGRLPIAQQVFLLAYGLGPIASRLYPTQSLRTSELEVALVGAVRMFQPNFALRTKPDGAVEDATEILKKSISRKWRRTAEIAATELVASPPADLARWQSAINLTGIRAALLIADDLAASIEALRYVIELPDGKGASLVHSSEAVRDLMRFWISNRASTVRVHTGMVPPNG